MKTPNNETNNLNKSQTPSAVNAISNAKKIYILGARTCSSIASFLGFYLNMISDNVKTIASNSASETFEQIYRVSKDDVVIDEGEEYEK